MDGCACDCGAFCESIRARRAGVEAAIIRDGRTPILTSSGILVWKRLDAEHCNLNEKLPFWRAGCGKTACPVRKAGRGQSLAPTLIGPRTVLVCSGASSSERLQNSEAYRPPVIPFPHIKSHPPTSAGLFFELKCGKTLCVPIRYL